MGSFTVKSPIFNSFRLLVFKNTSFVYFYNSFISEKGSPSITIFLIGIFNYLFETKINMGDRF